MAGSSDPYFMYIYQLPYSERKALCRILDRNDAWEDLGGEYMKFDVGTIERVRQAILRQRSPTDELLFFWGTQNHTVLELFVLLSKMQHYQAMTVLKPLVNPQFHRLIYEGEENFSRMLSKKKDNLNEEHRNCGENIVKNNVNGGKDLCFGVHNLNLGHTAQASGGKILFEKMCDVSEDEGKKLNTPEKGDKTTQLSQIKNLVESNLFVCEGLSQMIDYGVLEEATGGWDRKNILGKGGFGTVFKGTWKNTQVAIKRLEVQKGGDMEIVWKTQREQSLRELKILYACRHDNILPLYGYSIGGAHDCLVYQFMPKGSLEDRLLCREGSPPLTWGERHNIATGTARGLQFLHTIRDKPLIHGDIKSANILLDPHLEPKIGDFGLAREGPLQQYTHVKVSRVHGTRPYLPDEFLRAKKFSTKVDTYSFGIVLFELATGLRAYDESRNYKFLKDQIEALGDARLNDVRDMKAGLDDGILFPSLVALGKCCVSTRAKDRPEMVSVLEKLNTMGNTKEMAQQAQYLVRHNSLTPATPFELQVFHDHLSQQKRLSPPPNHTNQVGFGAPPCYSPQPVSPVLPHFISPSNVPSKFHQGGSLNPYLLPGSSDSPNNQQTPVPTSNTISPTIKVQPPSAPNFSELLPQIINQDFSDGCDLPLISELGIKSNYCETGKDSASE